MNKYAETHLKQAKKYRAMAVKKVKLAKIYREDGAHITADHCVDLSMAFVQLASVYERIGKEAAAAQ